MKIGSCEAKPTVPANSASSAERMNGAAPAAAAPEASASVQLSSVAAGGADDGTFDAQKVERIAAAIRDGKFQINPEAIADKLIVNAAELLGRKPS